MASLIGQKVGRYQILEILGEGGMATVYKAYDDRLEREVAIKVIRRGAFPEDEMDMLLKRFERESKALGKLSHPNIVGVIDYGEHEGAPYMVMVYVPGGTLKKYLGKPMPWRDAVHMIVPIARALEYVHERNIINRDVKPSNILMTEKGIPMLSDFGLVKLFEDNKEGTNLTSSGSGLGTPDYMAPEQWTGEATKQSDLYSLGVVLYEMITAHRPYTADTPAGILLKQATEALPLPKLYVPDLPHDVESILLKVLARKPGDRYPDVGTFADELQNLLAGREVAATLIRTEQLREQMTGKMERPSASPSHPTPAPRNKSLATLLGIGGAFVLLIAIGAVAAFSYPALFGLATPTETTKPLPVIPATAPAIETSVSTAPTTAASPTATTFPEEITDNKRVTMRLIPGGEFTMGSDGSEADSKPAHKVSVDAFYIDKYEVTNEMYDACAYAVKCRKPLQLGSATRQSYYSSPVFKNYPVIYVDWKMAKAYCEWRGARLPTEAEWEKAARGTDGRAYPWGDKADCSFGNLAGCVGDTSSVDQYEKGQSQYGVFGMSGNVWEWTSTLFKIYPYVATDGRENLELNNDRVARGGAWKAFGNNGNARTDTRYKLPQAYYGAYVGIRCAKSITQ